ncbi:MAG: CC/Se motif family (seleno)protein [Bacillota bacterium]
MKLNVDPEAAAFIAQEGGQAIIFAGKTGGCCTIGWLLEPMVELGEPRRPLEEYQVMQVGGATLYLDRALESVEQTYRLHLTRVLNWKSLSVSYEGG